MRPRIKGTHKERIPRNTSFVQKDKKKVGETLGKMEKTSFLHIRRIRFVSRKTDRRYPEVSLPEFMRMHVIVPIVKLIDHSGSTNDEIFEMLVRRHEHPLRMISHCCKRATQYNTQSNCLLLITHIQTVRMEILFLSLRSIARCSSKVYDTVLLSVEDRSDIDETFEDWCSIKRKITEKRKRSTEKELKGREIGTKCSKAYKVIHLICTSELEMNTTNNHR